MSIRHSKFQFGAYAVSLLITLLIAAVASYFTVPQISGWYRTINKPLFNPPNQLFGPVWTVLYILIATSAYMVWKKRDNSTRYAVAQQVYFAQLFLNFAWSIVFFGLHQIFLALVVIGLLLISIVLTMYYFNRFSKTACWLLLPYLLWVSFASALNLYIYLLNR